MRQKSKIDREDTATWFNVFNIIFELVSAYGTVGLSLGSPTANYSSVTSSLVIMCILLIVKVCRYMEYIIQIGRYRRNDSRSTSWSSCCCELASSLCLGHLS
jgi:hypothetical protein